MRKALLTVLVILFLASSAAAGNVVTLAWDAPADPSVTGYKLYYGTASRTYTANVDVKNVTEYMIQNLTLGTRYYFAVTAYDAYGNESDYSNEVDTTIKRTMPPKNNRIKSVRIDVTGQ